MIKLQTKDFLVRLNHLGSTIKCGLHSGIPPCCVHYYATEWLWKTARSKRLQWKKIDKVSEELGRVPGYIPCPACLKAKRFIDHNLKKCTCLHGEECAGEYHVLSL